MIEFLPNVWRAELADEFSQPYFRRLQEFVDRERRLHPVFPAAQDVFTALRLTPPDRVKVLILGQDPYHDDGQAHGLSFSVRRGMKLPPSLRNIYKELETDLHVPPPTHGCLEQWASQGVLLLNTVLTVRAHAANSHGKQGWEEFTTRVMERVNERPAVAFVLWGKPAQQKASLIDKRHLVIQSAHPSPLSARRGFFGSRPFSRINEYLVASDQTPVDWQLTE
ncbi:MAG: uracil-DNA glycosylase [Planctomycetaceae bacterium]